MKYSTTKVPFVLPTFSFFPNPQLEAYTELVDVAESCSDADLKKKLDRICIQMAIEFQALSGMFTTDEKTGGYSSSQLLGNDSYRACDEYTVEAPMRDGNICVYRMLRYRRREAP